MKARFLSELFGTAFLLMIVVGSGIMGENLANGNVAIALLANSIATGAGLWVLIQSLGPISGAHFNPAVSLIELLWKRLTLRELVSYWLAQFSGAFMGVLSAHLIFGLKVFQISGKARTGINLGFSEFVATFGLISVIALAGKKHPDWAPFAIASYITSAYWFTSSTSFANPAVTFARMFTDTFCGIAPSGFALFCIAQIAGALCACLLLNEHVLAKAKGRKETPL